MKIIKKIIQKWSYSLVGLWVAFREEKSLWTYFIIFPSLIGLGIYAKLNLLEWALLAFISFVVISIEVMNTALEATVDTISFQYNIKVKKIKDIASAATLVITVGAIIAISIIFIIAFQRS